MLGKFFMYLRDAVVGILISTIGIMNYVVALPFLLAKTFGKITGFIFGIVFYGFIVLLCINLYLVFNSTGTVDKTTIKQAIENTRGDIEMTVEEIGGKLND